MNTAKCFAALTLVTLVVAAAPAQASPTCVMVQFSDRAGKPVTTSQPVIAAVIGGQLFLPSKGPANTTFQAGSTVVCPPKIVADVAATYKKSCATAQQRDATARDNKITRTTVDQNCAGLQAFLTPVR